MKYLIIAFLGGLAYLLLDYIGALVIYAFRGKGFRFILKEYRFQNRVLGVIIVTLLTFLVLS